MNDRLKRYRQGLGAETIAAWFLRCKGYVILERRYKTGMGEIDIIARRKNIVAFVEVKRRGTSDDALNAVTPRAQARIAQAARLYMAHKRGIEHCDFRFDILAVSPFGLVHLDNAWQPPA